jgi:hypothetical protein
MVRRLFVRVSLAAIPFVMIPIAITSIGAKASAAPPAQIQQCMNGGWRTLTDASGQHFQNQGQCIAFAIHHRVSLSDLADPFAIDGTTSFALGANGCSFVYQVFDATYPGTAAVGAVILHLSGCVSPSLSSYAGSFNITTNVGTLSGSASGPVNITAGLGLEYQLTLTVNAATGSFVRSTGSLDLLVSWNTPNQSPSSFVGSISVP